jgi:hypothetical protein
MVWAGVCESGKTPLIFVPQGLKIDSNAYQTLILTKLLKWGRKHFERRHWCLQQDWAPAHGSRSTLEYLRNRSGIRNFWWKETWPSNSPDLNPLDYGIWGLLEAKISNFEIDAEGGNFEHSL